jgi:class 3 adenylate cyclase
MTPELLLPAGRALPGRHAAIEGPAERARDARPLPEDPARGQLVILPGGADRSPANDRAGRPASRLRTRPDTGRFLTTVLITDIVDSTETLARLGDEGWRERLGEHYVDCRAAIEGGGGEIVATAGDGVIAIFDSPTRAVRAGMAIEAAARSRGIAARAGVHSGECEHFGEGIVGLSVHIAARVCALAGADEVMTTNVVRDLTLGSLLEFEFCGTRALKGVPGDWAVFKVTDTL